MDAIASVEDLEEHVGGRLLPALIKSIDALDAHCERFLALAPFAVVGLRDAEGRRRAAAVGGKPGFARVDSPGRMRVPLPEGAVPEPGSGAALIFFVPGLGETLRVNGRATADGDLRIEVEEAFVHCAKAVIRSGLWTGGVPAESAGGAAPGEGPLADAEVRSFLARATFAALASGDASGAADVSPKGDPAGFLLVRGGTVAVPDRPGNRRTDTFHNLLEEPSVALLALAPGDPRALELTGRASLTKDEALLAAMTVKGKVPKIAMLLEVERCRLAPCPALEASGLWDPALVRPAAELPKMARVLVDHVKQNKIRGLAALAMRKLVAEKPLARGLAKDYEDNLY